MLRSQRNGPIQGVHDREFLKGIKLNLWYREKLDRE
jgi:hypothetical protein